MKKKIEIEKFIQKIVEKFITQCLKRHEIKNIYIW